MFCCVRGYAGRRAQRTMVSPTRWTPFPFRPMHAWLVWCWPALVWYVYGHVVAAAVVLLVHGCVSRLMVGLLGVGSLALQRASARSDVARVVAMLVSVLVGSSCVGPAWYLLTVRRPLIVGEKSNDRWSDRCEKFPNSLLHSLSRPGSVTCTTNHSVFRSALRPSFQLRLCHSYVHPRRWQRPVGPPWCISLLPMRAPGCCSSSVVRCWCSCLPACRVPYRAVSCGLCGWRVGVAVRCLAVRVARLVLWCRDAPTGVAGWVRRNTSVLAGRSRRDRGSRVASLWSLACSWWGSGGKEYWSVSKLAPRSLTLLTFRAAGNVSLVPFLQVTCAESAPASQAFNFPVGGARRSHRRTYPLILALEGNILDDCSITFPRSSARPWVPRVWLAPWPSPLWVRFAGEEG